MCVIAGLLVLVSVRVQAVRRRVGFRSLPAALVIVRIGVRAEVVGVVVREVPLILCSKRGLLFDIRLDV